MAENVKQHSELCDNCRVCKYAKIINSFDDSYNGCYGFDWENISCAHPSYDGKFYIVDEYVESCDNVTPPAWCPCRKNERSSKETSTTVTTPKKQYKTMSQLSDVCRNLTPITSWDDLKVGEIYHCPPIGNNKRGEFFIIEKNQHMIRVKKITSIETCTGYKETIFKDSEHIWKFFSKNKLIDLSQLCEKCKKEAEEDAKYRRTYTPSMF